MSTTTLTTPPTTTNRLTIEDRVTVPSLPVDGPRVSVVIPTLNEAPNLPAVVDRLPVGIWQLIIVDGRSTDDTIDVARRLRPDATIVTETRKGKGIALQTGFAAATGDIIVMLDADGSTDPAEIPLFVEALTNGADFAKGSRFLPGAGSSDITPLRRLGNTVLCAIANLGWGSRYHQSADALPVHPPFPVSHIVASRSNFSSLPHTLGLDWPKHCHCVQQLPQNAGCILSWTASVFASIFVPTT
jgi:glycosyltransferase involved in cell wall biosynthesis